MAATSDPVSAPSETIDIVVADDHAIVREGICSILEAESDLHVVGQASSVAETERAVVEHHPTVLLLDVLMRDESSLPVLDTLREAAPSTAIVMVTVEENALVARDALQRGAMGYVGKGADSSRLIEAVRAAASGRAYLEAALGARLAKEHSDGWEQLSGRDLEILRLVALGHTSAEIAASLCLSARTVEGYRRAVQKRLGLSTRADVVRYVRERRLSG